jgi:hypothetical protein
MRTMIEDFGARVVSVWEGMRPTTRSLIVGALQSSPAGTAVAATTTRNSGGHYDARADWELSRLLAALDERAAEAGASLNAEQARELRRMAETCAVVLQHQTQSAEVLAQLVERAFSLHDYARIDALADALAARFAPSEVCELARNPHVVVRALAQESLAQSPTAMLIGLLTDPVDSDVARDALERQAEEYGSEQARQIVHLLNQADMAEDEA